MSNTVGGKAGATGSGTLGSFSCGGIEIRGGLSGLVEGRAAIQVSGWTCSYERLMEIYLTLFGQSCL